MEMTVLNLFVKSGMNGVGVVHQSKPNLLGWLGTECHFNTALVEKGTELLVTE